MDDRQLSASIEALAAIASVVNSDSLTTVFATFEGPDYSKSGNR
jgi:hypothetical protein